ncbi:MAG: hypothetical protein ACM3Q3_04200, partial [Nitrospirota bacterium]
MRGARRRSGTPEFLDAAENAAESEEPGLDVIMDLRKTTFCAGQRRSYTVFPRKVNKSRDSLK